jgi:hypothetical protein
MDAQLDHTFANGLAVAEVAGLDLAQAQADARLRCLVANRFEPLGERLATVSTPIAKKLDGRGYCSLKATVRRALAEVPTQRLPGTQGYLSSSSLKHAAQGVVAEIGRAADCVASNAGPGESACLHRV